MDMMKDKVTEVVEAIMKSSSLKEQFEKEPVKAIESVLGVDLPDELIEMVIERVKNNLTPEDITKVTDVLKKLFYLIGKFYF